MSTPMLRQAVRTVLADAGDRQPSHEAWGLVLMAAGVDATKAAGLPARLGYVFHLGRWREQDVVVQLGAWGDALRVRAEPEVAAVVDRAAAALAAEMAAAPLPDPERAAAAPLASPTPPRQAPPPQRQVPPPPQQQGPPQQGPQQQDQASPWAVLPPGTPTGAPSGGGARPGGPGTYVPTAGRGAGSARPTPQGGRATPRGARPRGNRLGLVIGAIGVVLLCGCSLIGVVVEMFSGSG